MSQQRKLLKLIPDLQVLVSQGEIPVRVARDIAGLPHGEQADAWAREVQRRAEAERAPRAPRARKATATAVAQPSPEVTRFTAVNQTAPPAPESGLVLAPVVSEQSLFTAVNQTSSLNEETASPVPVLGTPQADDGLSTPPGVPDPRAGLPGASQLPKPPVKMPWADGVASMDIIFAKLQEGERRRAIAHYIELLGTAEAFVDDLSAASDPAFRAQVAELLLKDM